MRPQLIGGAFTAAARAVAFLTATFTEACFDDRPLLGSMATTFNVYLPGLRRLPKSSFFELAPGCALKSTSLTIFEPFWSLARMLEGLSSVRWSVVLRAKVLGLAETFDSTGA